MTPKKPRAPRGPGRILDTWATIRLPGLEPEERWCNGPIDMQLLWLAEQLRLARTKAHRVAIADALDRLSTFITRQRVVRGRRGPRESKGTWRLVALVKTLQSRQKVEQRDAVMAVAAIYKCRGKDLQRLERYLRKRRSGTGPHFLSFNEADYRKCLSKLPRTHRTN